MTADRTSLRKIPPVDLLLIEVPIAALSGRLSHATLVGLIREELDATRRAYLAGELGAADLAGARIATRVATRASQLSSPPLRKVINATGILIHTNLGRAPLSAGAQQAVADVFAGYSNLELDLATGKRTSRLGRVRDLLVRVTGAQDALAVNNNAAAVMLALHALAGGKEVVVSRGEQVEIGGSFRLPDVIAASGARMREVGTTNRTRLSDYRTALADETAMLLKIHPSNYQIEGYTEAVSTGELAALAAEYGLIMLEDLGSGALEQHPRDYLKGEPRVQATLRAGADLVCCSGDKLFGGPQAGILLGRRDLIERLGTDPLARVLRLDKLHLAALEATLIEYLAGEAGLSRIPLYRLMSRPIGELRVRGEELILALRANLGDSWRLELIETEAAAGGGSLPGQTIPSIGVALARPAGSMEALARFLRMERPAIMGRIAQDRLVLDLRSLLEEEWEMLPGLLSERLSAFESQGEGD